MREIIRSFVRDAVESAVRTEAIKLESFDYGNIEVSRPKEVRFGDYSTNAAMVLSGPAGLKPRDLARIITDNIRKDPGLIERTEIAGPGFINFFMAGSIWQEVLHEIHARKERYGQASDKGYPKVLVEFVSANPTGPLHVGHGRGAAVGDSLARLLKTQGWDVRTEYYVNDAGNQMRILGRSLLFRYKQMLGETIDFPENHYVGDYIKDLARELADSPIAHQLQVLDEDKSIELCAQFACNRILKCIRDDLELFNVSYDDYFSERTLHETGKIRDTVEMLRRQGRVEDKDGAVWFTMEGQEDEKDRVLIRATGEPTYFAADAAYHRDKLERGFGRLIDIWGSDHHGYVPRLKAAVEALDESDGKLEVLLVQFVTLVRGGGEKFAMSTRAGLFETLRDVLEEVGPDAARFFFLTKRADSHLVFDLDLAKSQSKENPVYYVQYVHARVASIFRIAQERGIEVDLTDPDLSALSLPEEQRIIKHLADFPDMLAEAAEALEPHRVTFYLLDLAELFHAYYHDNRVLTEDSQTKKARLYLVEAVRQVVANGLQILGVSAPERM